MLDHPLRPRQLLVALLVAGLALACRPDASAPTGPSAGDDTVVVAWAVDMRDVNELIAQATPIHNALHNIMLFQQLIEEQADFETGPSSFAPGLATSWEFSDDRLDLTFHLRPDAVWSDGEPITAEDVRWTYEAHTNPDVAWTMVASKQSISGVEVLDEHTVRFHFTKVYATQLLDAIFGVILPEHAWSQLPFSEWRSNSQWFLDHLVVSGPYTLESWEPGQRFVLRRNPRYFRKGLPKTERIVFQIVPESSSQLAMLRSGQAHLIDNVQPSDAAGIEADPALDLYAFPYRQFNFLCWNTLRPFFATKELRQAMVLAIDRQAIIDSIYYGYATIATSPFPNNVWAHDASIEPWPYDPARARELLAAGGWTDSDGDGTLDKNGVPLRFEVLTNSSNQIRQDIQVILQNQLRRVGVDARPRVVEFNTELEMETSHEFDACLGAAGIDTSLDMSFFFHSRSADGGYNFGVYSNPEVDRVLEEIVEQPDQLSARPLFDRLQELLHEDQPFAFLYVPKKLMAGRKTLRHVDPNALSPFFHIAEWELVEER